MIKLYPIQQSSLMLGKIRLSVGNVKVKIQHKNIIKY